MTDPACASDSLMSDVGLGKTRSFLHKTADAIHQAAKSPHAEAIHKMRVSIRRFQQSIRLFRQFMPKKGVRTVRAELKTIMEPAGQLRNLDIAIRLVRGNSGNTDEIAKRRVEARHALQGHLRQFTDADLAGRWVKQLGLQDEEDLEK